MPLDLPASAYPHLDALLERTKATHTDQLAISWGDAGQSWNFGGGSDPIQTMSVTKSVVGLVVGRLITLGKLSSVDVPVHQFFPEWRQGRKRQITIRMLLDHTSGLQNVPLTTEEIYPSPDFVKLALCAELESEPGTTFSYNNKAVNLLAGLVERCDGRKLDAFAKEELFDPIGIDDWHWLHDDAGNPHAMSGLALHASDLMKLGRLLLQRGLWNGSRLIAETWFDAMDESAKRGMEPALGWWHLFETRIEVNEAHLKELRQGSASAADLEVFESLKGEHRSLTSFFGRLQLQLGSDWRTRIPRGLEPFKLEQCGPIGYRAEGDLGQYVLVLPQVSLVVVRLISEATIARSVPDFGVPPKTKEEHLARIGPFLFEDFEELVLDLARALA